MRYRRPHRCKPGFALIVVLWVVTGIAVIGAGLTMSVRDSLATAQNRVDLLRASWRAQGCTEAARSVIDDSLGSNAGQLVVAPTWSRLDAILSRSVLVNGCTISLRPSGMTVDINDADSARIRAVLSAIGQTVDQADSLVSALLDWRDPDDGVRAAGAERPWYSGQHRPGPRNGRFASIDELRLVRGFDQIGGLDTLFGVDEERIDLDAAPLAVLASLPGFDSQVLAGIAEERARSAFIKDLNSFASTLPPNTRAQLLAHYPELVKLTTTTPEAWTLTSRESVGSPPLFVTLELRLANAGSRAAIIRRRSWP